jgi:membrane associated rhomboid family serine protease
MALKVRYNSPVILTFSLICIAVYLIDLVPSMSLPPNSIGPITREFFTLSGIFDWSNPMGYVRMITYTMGHANQAHIMGNMSLFLLIAPMMEEKYGSRKILMMMVVTALVTAVFQILLFNTSLLGASGLVFMFIVLVSFANVQRGSIPLTFILVVLFYLGQEVIHSMQVNNVSEYGHLMGGVMGGIFGATVKRRPIADEPEPIVEAPVAPTDPTV